MGHTASENLTNKLFANISIIFKTLERSYCVKERDRLKLRLFDKAVVFGKRYKHIKIEFIILT